MTDKKNTQNNTKHTLKNILHINKIVLTSEEKKGEFFMKNVFQYYKNKKKLRKGKK